MIRIVEECKPLTRFEYNGEPSLAKVVRDVEVMYVAETPEGESYTKFT